MRLRFSAGENSTFKAPTRAVLEQSRSRARVYAVGIVVDGTQTKTTWHLQRELNGLLDAERGARWKQQSPLGAYLTGRAQPSAEAPQRALFPGPGLTESQRAALDTQRGRAQPDRCSARVRLAHPACTKCADERPLAQLHRRTAQNFPALRKRVARPLFAELSGNLLRFIAPFPRRWCARRRWHSGCIELDPTRGSDALNHRSRRLNARSHPMPRPGVPRCDHAIPRGHRSQWVRRPSLASNQGYS